MNKSKFKPFWFECSVCFRMVKSLPEFYDLVDFLKNNGYKKFEVLDAKECVHKHDLITLKKFGFTNECNGDRTLFKYLTEVV